MTVDAWYAGGLVVLNQKSVEVRSRFATLTLAAVMAATMAVRSASPAVVPVYAVTFSVTPVKSLLA